MKNRRQYDKEFKQMAVELSRNHDNFRELAKELDIRPELLYRWRREAGKHPDSCFPGKGKVAQTEYEKELTRLKKELRDAQLERDILKKAVSIFSKSDGKHTGL